MANVKKSSSSKSKIVEPNKLPLSFQTQILQRFMTPDALLDFYAEYRSACTMFGRHIYQPSEVDIDVWKRWINGETNERQAAEEMDCHLETVHKRFGVISRMALQDNLSALKGKWKK